MLNKPFSSINFLLCMYSRLKNFKGKRYLYITFLNHMVTQDNNISTDVGRKMRVENDLLKLVCILIKSFFKWIKVIKFSIDRIIYASYGNVILAIFSKLKWNATVIIKTKYEKSCAQYKFWNIFQLNQNVITKHHSSLTLKMIFK